MILKEPLDEMIYITGNKKSCYCWEKVIYLSFSQVQSFVV